MRYITEADFKSLGEAERTHLLTTHYPLGVHPETGETLLMPLIDRHSGMYVVGVQGVGKSGLLINQIVHDIHLGNAVIVIDPHGDLVTQCIARLPPERSVYASLLEMEDVDHPFGLNIFNSVQSHKVSDIEHVQAIDRVMHVFETLWPDILSQAYLPRYLRAACIVLLANPGSTLVDMLRFLVDSPFRNNLMQNVRDPTVNQFWASFDAMSATQQRQQVEPLIGRLESLFMGRSLVRNIVGQRETTINFRQAIENKEIIFIRLPLKTMPQDARLIGTLLIAQIHATIFSFGDIPEDKRPVFSLYVDEFQNFATPDFAEMFTEGRKFGVRVCLAHQYRSQVPSYLQHSTMTARTKVCFQVTPDDARELSHLFNGGEGAIAPQDLETRPIEHLLKYDSDDYQVQTFTNTYLRPLHAQVHSGQVEIWRPGTRWDHLPFWILSVQAPTDKPKVDDPTPYLNHLLYEVMKTGDLLTFIDPKIVYGFSNMGGGFYPAFRYALNKRDILTGNIRYPSPLIVEGRNGLYCARRPEGPKEQMYHFLFHLQATMAYLAANPIGKKSSISPADVAQMLTSLPKRAAFVRSGDDIGVIYTHNITAGLSGMYLETATSTIRQQTRQRYCRPRKEFRDTNTPREPSRPMSRWEQVE